MPHWRHAPTPPLQILPQPADRAGPALPLPDKAGRAGRAGRAGWAGPPLLADRAERAGLLLQVDRAGRAGPCTCLEQVPEARHEGVVLGGADVALGAAPLPLRLLGVLLLRLVGAWGRAQAAGSGREAWLRGAWSPATSSTWAHMRIHTHAHTHTHTRAHAHTDAHHVLLNQDVHQLRRPVPQGLQVLLVGNGLAHKLRYLCDELQALRACA